MASYIQIAREETCCHHLGYSFRLAASVLLYAPSNWQDSTYHNICYTSRGALAGMRNSSMSPPWRTDLTTHRIMSEHLPQSYISLLQTARGNSMLQLYGFLFLISRQDSTYHGFCYTSHGALAGTSSISVGPPLGINPMANCTMSRSSNIELHLAPLRGPIQTND